MVKFSQKYTHNDIYANHMISLDYDPNYTHLLQMLFGFIKITGNVMGYIFDKGKSIL